MTCIYPAECYSQKCWKLSQLFECKLCWDGLIIPVKSNFSTGDTMASIVIEDITLVKQKRSTKIFQTVIELFQVRVRFNIRAVAYKFLISSVNIVAQGL